MNDFPVNCLNSDVLRKHLLVAFLCL